MLVLLAPQFVVAINNPLMWPPLTNAAPPAAIGASAYIGIARHQALRLNYATYEVDNPQFILGQLIAPDGSDPACGYEVSGHSDDIGVGWTYFLLRERWHGPSVELGAVRKSMHLAHCFDDGYGNFQTMTHTTSTAYVTREMVGWSWLYGDRLFASIGAGVSVGREAGTDDRTGAHFHHAVAYPEFYVRIGVALL